MRDWCSTVSAIGVIECSGGHLVDVLNSMSGLRSMQGRTHAGNEVIVASSRVLSLRARAKKDNIVTDAAEMSCQCFQQV